MGGGSQTPMKFTLYPKYLIRSLFVHGRRNFFKAGYKLLYPEYSRHGMTPWQHYVVDGKRKGFDNGTHPSDAVFFPEGYELEYPDVKAAGVDPWCHYAEKGAAEGRDNGFHPKDGQFFAEGYLEMYPDVFTSGMKPWNHYVLMGKRAGRDNGLHPGKELFFADGYIEMYPDVAKSGMDPWHHYVLIGKKAGLNNGLHPRDELFFACGYVLMHPDVAKSGMDPWRHYVLVGKKALQNDTDPKLGSKKPAVVWLDPDNSSYDLNHSEVPSVLKHLKRCAIVSSHPSGNAVDDRSVDYLQCLKCSVDFTVLVYDGPLQRTEIEKLKGLADVVCCVSHGCGVFGSYKLGINFLRNKNLLDVFDELVLCSDSAFIPSGFFKKYFAGTEAIAKKYDFYGWSSVSKIKYRLQSCLLCFSKKVFTSPCFNSFFDSVTSEADASVQVLKYETELTASLEANGFTCSSLLKSDDFPETCKYGIADDLSDFPIHVFEHLGYLLIKSEVLTKLGCNNDGIFHLLSFLEKHDADFFRKILSLNSCLVSLYEAYKAKKVGFSFVIPTYNRAGMISDSIDSVLRQNYDNYEIVISDDVSTDNTVQLLNEKYSDYIGKGVIKIILNDGKGKGVCHARNLALSAATKEFIAYLDSDNCILPNFLDNFVDAILFNPKCKTFYGKSFRKRKTGWISVEKEFDKNILIKGNYIDLGVFVHSRSLCCLGGFDEKLRRLVDWDLILRYTYFYPPVWSKNVIVEYNDQDDYPRISNTVDLQTAYDAIRKKLNDRSVTTIILAYNHELYISQTIESALMQSYGQGHKILISDDMSSDNTRKIIKYYADKYSDVITDISNNVNKGFSGNLKYCLAHVSTKYVEILEGDDYYMSSDKVKTQEEVLFRHPEYMMVFSKLRLFNTKSLKFSYLARQENLEESVCSGDVLNEPSLNLIANFTSCMFRTDFLRILPERAFKPRLTEMAVAFTALKFGKIGYINTPLTVYRVHEGSLWSGKNKLEQLKEGCEVRKTLRAISGIKQLDHIIESYEKQIKELTGDVS